MATHPQKPRRPFHRKIKDEGNTTHIVVPKHVTWKRIKERTSEAQRLMIWEAQKGIYKLRHPIYRVYTLRYISASDYELIKQFMRHFMFTPRRAGHPPRNVYRLPTMDEICAAFPQLKAALQRDELEKESRGR